MPLSIGRISWVVFFCGRYEKSAMNFAEIFSVKRSILKCHALKTSKVFKNLGGLIGMV
jgi:hypothetical protein